MKKLWKNTIITTSIILSAGIIATAIAVPLVLANSNNKTESNGLIALNDYYLSNEKQYLSSNDAQLPNFDITQPTKNFDTLTTNANNAIDDLKTLKVNSNLNENENIWVDSYITQWEIKKSNLSAGTVFLGANPINGDQILSSSSNHVRKYVSDAVNIYPINEETGDPDKNAQPDVGLVHNLINKINQASDIVQHYQLLLKVGAEQYGYMPSTIQKKLLLNQWISFFYAQQINTFANSNNNLMDLVQFFNQPSTNDYFDKILQDLASKNLGINLEVLATSLNSLRHSLNEFIIFYGGTTYYGSSSSYGPATNGQSVILTKTRNSEIEKTLSSDRNVLIYGLGISKAELDTSNIGIGYMNVNTANTNNFKYALSDANDVYQQLLFNNNSINDLAEDIYNSGIALSLSGADNMKTLATLAKPIIVGNLNNNIMYDPDGIGTDAVISTPLTGTDFEKFNKWLNQESFFWGRETFANSTELNAFINKYWTNPTGAFAQYKNIIIEQGYEKNWAGINSINGRGVGSVTGNQALAGAVLSLNDYIDFRDKTNSLFDASFNPIADYIISPYNYNIREDVGVGLEGPRGSKQFQYNCDPYYSLPKWSVSSLTSHEGKMGHHTQQQYWTEYLQNGDGSNGTGPGYTFTNVAFHEGWAVFAEWYTNELGVYGSNLNPVTRMPTDWLNAKGLVPNWDASQLTALNAQMRELHGGVYYNNAVGNNDTDRTRNSIQLGNMLQYYGYLNEAQLRNMRLALDTSIHHKAIGGSTTLPFGSSIQKVRDFMKNNSALSVGDINSESFRYAVMPSQATGYMLGKIVFEDIYNDVSNKLGINLANNTTEAKKLFDLMLRNGEIPLQVLSNLFLHKNN